MRSERLREIREARGLSQAELATRIGLAANSISRYENGENDPTGDVVAKLCRELSVTSDYLLGLVDKPDTRIATPDNLDPEALRILAAVDSGNPIALLDIMKRLVDLAHEGIKAQLSEQQTLEKQLDAVQTETASLRKVRDMQKKLAEKRQ